MKRSGDDQEIREGSGVPGSYRIEGSGREKHGRPDWPKGEIVSRNCSPVHQ